MIKLLLLLLTIINSYQKYDLVEVQWVDIIATDGGWRSDAELEEWSYYQCDTVQQVGYVVNDNSDYLILTDSYFKCDSSTLGYCVKIPKGTIISIKLLKHE